MTTTYYLLPIPIPSPSDHLQIDNFDPSTSRVPTIANHIGSFLQSPDIVFLQEIQYNNGEIDDGPVDANVTLSTLANAIEAVSGVKYSFIDINPINDMDGGAGGGNIRQAYL